MVPPKAASHCLREQTLGTRCNPARVVEQGHKTVRFSRLYRENPGKIAFVPEEILLDQCVRSLLEHLVDAISENI
jgi:hypothetical protein